MTFAHEPSNPLDVTRQDEREFLLVSLQLLPRQLQMLNRSFDVDDGEDGTKASRNATTQSSNVEIVVMTIQT